MNIQNFKEHINAKYKEYLIEYDIMADEDDDAWVYLISIAVVPWKRDNGIGSKIMNETIDWAKANGFAGILLSVSYRERKQLNKFYSRFGFVISDKFEMKLEFFND
jgi:GNAT superfamily N-acetyltransferase